MMMPGVIGVVGRRHATGNPEIHPPLCRPDERCVRWRGPCCMCTVSSRCARPTSPLSPSRLPSGSQRACTLCTRRACRVGGVAVGFFTEVTTLGAAGAAAGALVLPPMVPCRRSPSRPHALVRASVRHAKARRRLARTGLLVLLVLAQLRQGRSGPCVTRWHTVPSRDRARNALTPPQPLRPATAATAVSQGGGRRAAAAAVGPARSGPAGRGARG